MHIFLCPGSYKTCGVPSIERGEISSSCYHQEIWIVWQSEVKRVRIRGGSLSHAEYDRGLIVEGVSACRAECDILYSSLFLIHCKVQQPEVRRRWHQVDSWLPVAGPAVIIHSLERIQWERLGFLFLYSPKCYIFLILHTRTYCSSSPMYLIC